MDFGLESIESILFPSSLEVFGRSSYLNSFEE